MEGVISRDGVRGVLVSGDEIDKIIIRKDKRVDLFMKDMGCFTFIIKEVEKNPNSVCELNPAEENTWGQFSN